MPDVTVEIDGQTIIVPANTNIVDAARQANVAIPVFCYHPKLTPVGMCRMCLVEVWTPRIDPATRQPVIGPDGKPALALMMNKLQPGCVTPVSDGMVVKTTTDKVKFAQKGQLEFLLHSHPLDCPVCDKGGECPLQNLTMQWGPGLSRFDYTDKVHFEKPIPLGDLIYLDRERCILCSRCVRFQDEIAGDPVLGFDNRGRNWEIISKSDPAFDSKFSGNTTDICPVGALTSSDFRFKARVWELRSTPSICPHCPVGCDLSLDMRHNELKRVMPRENDFVNEIWICDKGRYGMRFFGDAERLTQPLVRKNGALTPTSWDEAYRLIAERLVALHAQYGAAALGGLAAPTLSNEDLYAFQKLVRGTLGSQNLDHRNGLPGEPALDDLTPELGVGSGTNLMTLGKGTAVLVFGADPEEEAPLYVLRLRGIVRRGGDLTVVHSYATKLEQSATRSLRPQAGKGIHVALALLKVILDERLVKTEFTDGRVRGIDALTRDLAASTLADLCAAAGVSEEDVRAAARAFAQAEHGILLIGRAALGVDPALPRALANLLLLTGKAGRANSGAIVLSPGGNSRGAHDMGVRPDMGPGATPLSRRGLSAREMWAAATERKLRALVVAGLNPAQESASVAQALDALEFLVVQDVFLTETAQRADVVLPMATFAEREGTFTNAERRVQRFLAAAESALPAPWESFQQVARLVQERVPAPEVAAAAPAKGKAAEVSVALAPNGWDYAVVSDLADEISATVRSYKIANYTSLGVSNASWGREANESFYYDGTSYVNSLGVGVQLAATADTPKSAHTVAFRAPQPVPADDRFPLMLLPVARAYDGGDWVRGSKLLLRTPPAHVILSVADAQRLGVGMGETVLVESAHGMLTLPAQVDAGLPAGTALLPLVRGAGYGDLVTSTVTPVAIRKAE